MPDLGSILLFFVLLLALVGAALMGAGSVWGDRQSPDLFIANLTSGETIRLGRNLLLWGVILSLLAFLLRALTADPSAPTAAAPNAAPTAAVVAAPAVPIRSANAPSKPVQGSYQAICVPPKNGGLNLRNGPGNAATVIAVIPCNTTGLQSTGATVTQDAGQWVPIAYNGTPGWVYRRLIRPSQ